MVTRPAMGRRAVRGWDENDAYTRWRHYLGWQRHERHLIKRRTHKRERREAQAEVKEQQQ